MTRRLRGLRLVALAALLLAVSATVSSCAGEAACQYNSDCFQEYCDNGTCKRDCINSAIDCAAGFYCNSVSRGPATPAEPTQGPTLP